MKRKKILFDLDGTLIDARQRLYRLFCFLVPENSLSFDAYWDRKRRMQDHTTILKQEFGWNDAAIAAFQAKWLALIEEAEWLQLDTVFDGSKEVLQQLAATCDLYLFTARQSEAKAISQLECLGLTSFFRKVYVTEHKVDKQTLLGRSLLQVEKEDIAVGDTGVDVQLAKSLSCVSIAVESGFRNKDVLLSYKPDFILPSIVDPQFLTICLQ